VLSLVTGHGRGGSVVLLHSPAGAGKTWLAALMGYAVGAGCSVFQRWHAEKPRKVLFIRSEKNDGLTNRLDEIHRSFGKSEAIQNVLVYFLSNLNLELEATWQSIAEMVDWADLIVIDHLTRVTNGSNNSQSWRRLESHFRKLTELGKSILLLHHTGKDGRQRGTSDHVIDVDLEISLERLEAPNGALVQFGKGRDDTHLGKDLTSFQLYWDRDSETDVIHWWTKEIEGAKGGTWIRPPKENASPARVIDEAYLSQHFDEQGTRVIHFFSRSYLKNKPNVQRAEIDVELGVGPSTTRAVLDGLISKKAIVVEGKGRATRYCLSGKLLDDVLR
jgi:hypothetical protein